MRTVWEEETEIHRQWIDNQETPSALEVKCMALGCQSIVCIMHMVFFCLLPSREERDHENFIRENLFLSQNSKYLPLESRNFMIASTTSSLVTWSTS